MDDAVTGSRAVDACPRLDSGSRPAGAWMPRAAVRAPKEVRRSNASPMGWRVIPHLVLDAAAFAGRATTPNQAEEYTVKLTRIAMSGAAGVMGLGLIGVGAHAAFTANTTSHQSVNAGSLSMVFTDPGVTGTGTTSVTLPAQTNNATSFTTGTVKLTVKNAGTLDAYNILSTIGVSNGGGGPTGALENESYVCLVATNGTATGTVFYNGPLAGAPHSQAVAGTEKPGTTAWYILNVYAGTEHTQCGTVSAYGAAAAPGTSTEPALTNNAEGGTITVTETLSYSAKP
jgi:predicted ribosomally synthesized peptide with SipW-like signal peptide